MSQSLAKILVHTTFSTKERAPLITTDVEQRLHAYVGGTFKGCDSPALTVGGTDTHLHALFSLSRTRSLADVLQEVKQSSSKWMKEQGTEHCDFQWQGGYGAFSIGESGVEKTKAYIESQKEHHRQRSFQDEFRALLEKYHIPYNENYLWT